MPFKEIKVQSYKVIHYCDNCVINTIHTGVVLDSYPAKYPHKCDSCNKVYNLDNVYPIHISKEIE